MLALWLVLAACGGSPPTDELIAAADALGRAELAERCAPEEYRAAERLLEQARQANREGDYDRALTLAQSAQEQAERARLMAQANADDCEALEELRDQSRSSDTEVVTEIDADYEFRPVYFAFDATALDQEARQTLQEHARFLSSNTLNLVVEGHCDPHGTDQYNLALGQARARAVAQYLITLGVSAQRISTISYGEFRPASPQDRLNRRAEFRVRQ